MIKGSVVIAAVKIDKWEMPSDGLKPIINKLDDSGTFCTLFLPSGWANGIIALAKDSELLVFSSRKEKEEYRFDKKKWINWDQIKKEFSR